MRRGEGDVSRRGDNGIWTVSFLLRLILFGVLDMGFPMNKLMWRGTEQSGSRGFKANIRPFPAVGIAQTTIEESDEEDDEE